MVRDQSPSGRRLPAKCASRIVTKRLSSTLVPLQLGAGCPNGAEAAAHAARAFVDNPREEEVLVKLDFSNAFNTLRRDRIAECIFDQAPDLYPFFKSCYENHSLLFHGEHFINSEEGLQQGDPIASLGFSISIQDLLRSIKSRYKLGYLDDINFGDHWKTALEDLLMIKEAGEKYGPEAEYRQMRAHPSDQLQWTKYIKHSTKPARTSS